MKIVFCFLSFQHHTNVVFVWFDNNITTFVKHFEFVVSSDNVKHFVFLVSSDNLMLGQTMEIYSLKHFMILLEYYECLFYMFKECSSFPL